MGSHEMPALHDIKTVEYADTDGQKMRVLTVGGIPLIPVRGLQENFPKLMEFQFRDGDIVVPNYPRSGSHLILEIISMLRQGSAEYIQDNVGDDYLEWFFRNDIVTKKTRVVTTHLQPELLPPDYRNRKCKFIHVYRNPKDTIVSLYHFYLNFKEYMGYDGTFAGFFELLRKDQVAPGNWITYELKYEEFFKSNPFPSLILRFEDLTSEPIASITKVSDFIGLDRDDQLIADIADAVSFSKMKAAKSEMLDTIFHPLYRKGTVGDWKNLFTVALNESFNEEYSRRMKNSLLYNEKVL